MLKAGKRTQQSDAASASDEKKGFFKISLPSLFSIKVLLNHIEPICTDMKKLVFLLLLCVSMLALTSSRDKNFYIREGSSSYGKVLYNFDGEYVREGSSSYGTIIYNINDGDIREGSSKYGKILFNIDGKYIREGSSKYGKIRYNLDGRYIREESSSYGKILYNID